jgi:hypothetical protein
MAIGDSVMFACGPGAEILYLFIPVAYIALFVGLLLGAIAFQFFAKSRAWSSPVLVGALTSIPGFLLGCGAAVLSLQCSNKMPFATSFPNPIPEIVASSIFLAPFGLATIGALMGFLVGFKAKRRRDSTACG